jgi:chemotaxis protein MotB
MFDDDFEEADNFYVSWSDLVTLLLVFFVYLFSISEIDIIKFLEAKESLNKSIDMKTDMDKLELIMLEKQQLKEMLVSMQAYIEKEKLENVVNVAYTDDDLEINMGTQFLFELGSAELRAHDLPIHTEQFPSNWELSSARASSVVRFLSSQRVNESRFLVLGYNMYAPLVPNDSVDNRAKNRRVKITLKPNMAHILDEYEKAKQVKKANHGN